MDEFEHTMSDLFAQLGLANSPREIDQFIHTNRPVPDGVPLAEADFWTQSQSRFLSEAITEDSDWAELVDQLDSRLRS